MNIHGVERTVLNLEWKPISWNIGILRESDIGTETLSTFTKRSVISSLHPGRRTNPSAASVPDFQER